MAVNANELRQNNIQEQESFEGDRCSLSFCSIVAVLQRLEIRGNIAFCANF